MEFIDQSDAFPDALLTLLRRNMVSGATFVTEGPVIRRLSEGITQGLGPAQWYRLSADALMPLLSSSHGFVVLESIADQVQVAFVETSWACFGYAYPGTTSAKRRKRKMIRESTDDLKTLVRTDRAMLRHFIALSDAYKRDPQLSSTEAKTAMALLLSGMYAQSPEQAAFFGQVEFEPNQMAWISLFDQVGEQTLAQFLGISSVADIPGGDLDQRADEIRDQAGADIEPALPAPEAMVASTPRTPTTLSERMQKYNHSINPMARHYYRNRKPAPAGK